MQRAKHIKEYIKRDEIEAYVEIELKGRPGKRNLVVRRSFQAESNSSKFEINGKTTCAGRPFAHQIDYVRRSAHTSYLLQGKLPQRVL